MVRIIDSESEIKQRIESKSVESCPFKVEGLDEQHVRKMIDSSLTLDTIKRTCAYTEHHLVRLRILLCGIPAVPPAMVLPFFDREGKRTDYVAARMMPPFRWPDGREAKYLMPQGLDCRAYFPPFPCIWQVVNNPGGMVVITEGVLKALAAAQAGIPCIGLMGMWNWCVKSMDKGDPRLLIPDLVAIDWRGKTVLIVPDADPVRKPGVHHGAAELARVLTDLGADARLPRLPLGPRGVKDGRPVKQAIDDYIVKHDGESFMQWVGRIQETLLTRSLDDIRAERLSARLDSRSKPRPTLQDFADYPAMCETLLDRGGTGTGKSYADFSFIRQQEENSKMRPTRKMTPIESSAYIVHEKPVVPMSLTVVPNHSHCEDVVNDAAKQGIEVVPYPKLTSETCFRHDEATAVQSRGLAFQMVLCPECPYRDDCPYRLQRERADNAQHAVSTHARTIHTLPRQTRRNLIILHEAPLDVISPSIVVAQPLVVVAMIAEQAECDAGDANDRGFYRHMARVAKELNGWLKGADKSDEVPLPQSLYHVPENVHKDLNGAILTLGSGAAPAADSMRLVLAAASGGLRLVGVGVDTIPDKSKPKAENAVKIVRKLVGVVNTDLPGGCWLNDATADRAEIEQALGRPVKDITPSGRLLLHHPVLQIIPERDVTKAREATAVLPLLRGILYDLPNYRRVGLLTHKKLSEQLPALLSFRGRQGATRQGPPLRRRVVAWEQQVDRRLRCPDRPRHPPNPPSDIRLHLYRLGKVKAGGRTQEEAGWGWDYWSGVTASGTRRTVKCWHYADHDWHSAYCSLVRTGLVQAIGRGRGILPQGIPVYVVTNENLAPPHDDDGRNGFPLAEAGRFSPLSERQEMVLSVLRGEGKGRIRLKTSEIAKRVGINPKTALQHLTELRSAGRVSRVGKAAGWIVSTRGASL